MTSPERILAVFAAEGETTEQSLRTRARILLADAMVLAAANQNVPGFDFVHEVGVGTGAHVSWASGRRLGPSDAVYANACAIHARFQDDTEMSTWSHPGSFVVPAAAGAAVEAGASLATLLDALVVGYAATRWLGAEGTLAPLLKARGFRPSPIFAPLGAAVAASRALGLSTEQTMHAVNSAAIVGRGTLHSVGGGGDDWRLHNASAARDGFCLALAAKKGMSAAAHGLTGANGFLATVTGVTDVPASWSSAPDASLVHGTWQKALPVLGDNIAAVLAARQLGPLREEAGRVRVHMNAQYAAFPGTQHRPPYASATARQASVRFGVAQALVNGDVQYDSLLGPDDPAVLKIADSLEVVPVEGMPFEEAVVEVEVRAGTLRSRASDLPSTYFWRDRDEQADRARHTLSRRGEEITALVLDAPEATGFAALTESAWSVAAEAGA